MLAAVGPSGKTFCIVSKVIIAPNIFFGSDNSIINLYCTYSIDDSTFSTANLFSELISVRDGLYTTFQLILPEKICCASSRTFVRVNVLCR
jgi:hypothetical protein